MQTPFNANPEHWIRQHKTQKPTHVAKVQWNKQDTNNEFFQTIPVERCVDLPLDAEKLSYQRFKFFPRTNGRTLVDTGSSAHSPSEFLFHQLKLSNPSWKFLQKSSFNSARMISDQIVHTNMQSSTWFHVRLHHFYVVFFDFPCYD